MTLKGFIFDFDGLILDTEMPGCQAWSEQFNEFGFCFTLEDWKKAIGTGPSAYDPASHLSELTNGQLDTSLIKKQTLQRTRDLIEKESTLPGVEKFIKEAHRCRLSLGVASSSDRVWVEGYLKKLNLINYFSSVSTADDVKKVKPHPELYLLTARRLHLKPNEIIVFEDSPNGVRAAREAGMFCIAIPNEITCSMDLSQANLIFSSFENIEIRRLFDLLN